MDLAGEILNGHGYLGYAVFALILVSVVRAAMAARSGAEYSDGLAKLAGLVLSLQWVYGILVYVQSQFWNAGFSTAVIHPLAMTGAVALAGIATARARKAADASDASDAWMAIAKFQGIALLLIIIGIGAVSAG